MRIPVTVDLNTLETYNYQTNKLIDNVLQSDDFDKWDKNIPNSLQELCVQALAQHWTGNFILKCIQGGTKIPSIFNLPFSDEMSKQVNFIYKNSNFVLRVYKILVNY